MRAMSILRQVSSSSDCSKPQPGASISESVFHCLSDVQVFAPLTIRFLIPIMNGVPHSSYSRLAAWEVCLLALGSCPRDN